MLRILNIQSHICMKTEAGTANKILWLFCENTAKESINFNYYNCKCTIQSSGQEKESVCQWIYIDSLQTKHSTLWTCWFNTRAKYIYIQIFILIYSKTGQIGRFCYVYVLRKNDHTNDFWNLFVQESALNQKIQIQLKVLDRVVRNAIVPIRPTFMHPLIPTFNSVHGPHFIERLRTNIILS